LKAKAAAGAAATTEAAGAIVMATAAGWKEWVDGLI
jgi:hypothetical protein